MTEPKRSRPPRGGAREAALLVLTRVDTGGVRADRLLESWFPAFSASHRDRALMTQLVNGTLRHRGYLDYLLGQLMRRGIESLPDPVRNILRISLFQLIHLDRIPHRAVVHEGVNLARRYGHEGTARLVNAVLREFLRRGSEIPLPAREEDPAAAIAVLHSHPEWMIRRWVRRYGVEETEALARVNNRIPPVTLRPHRGRTDRSDLAGLLRREGLHPEPGRVYPDALVLRENVFLPGLEAYRRGLFQVQDEASCLIAPMLGVRPGDTVLDLCAGPGGKTTHLAELVGEKGRVIAADIAADSLRRVVENGKRLRLNNVLPVLADGATLALSRIDHVLVDAPCSGLGVLARRADARWRREESDIRRFARLQVRLLRHAVNLVRPGGAVLYSTCTIEPEENELVIHEILRERPDVVTRRPELPPGVDAAVLSEDGYMHLLPHRQGCDGGFAALIVKRTGPRGEG